MRDPTPGTGDSPEIDLRGDHQEHLTRPGGDVGPLIDTRQAGQQDRLTTHARRGPPKQPGTVVEYAIDALRGLGYILVDCAFLASVRFLNHIMDVYVWQTLTSSTTQRDISIVVLQVIFTVGTVGYALLRMLKSLMIEAINFGLTPLRLRSYLRDLKSPHTSADSSRKP